MRNVLWPSDYSEQNLPRLIGIWPCSNGIDSRLELIQLVYSEGTES